MSSILNNSNNHIILCERLCDMRIDHLATSQNRSWDFILCICMHPHTDGKRSIDRHSLTQMISIESNTFCVCFIYKRQGNHWKLVELAMYSLADWLVDYVSACLCCVVQCVSASAAQTALCFAHIASNPIW